MVDHPSQERDPVELLAEEFLERRRRGEVPSLKEYADRYPHLADEIQDVFPALVLMDDIDPQSAELGRSLGGAALLRGRPELRQLGDFRILREIGQGGMGIVYEAQQESLGRHVALKVLPPAISRRELFRERFQREARAAARLHHTNIVPIFGVGEDQGVLYYAMQFIQGQGLDAVLEDIKRLRGLVTTVNPAEQPTLVHPAADVARSLMTGRFGAAEPVETGQPLPPPAPVPVASGSDTYSDLRRQPEYTFYRSLAWLGVQAAEGLAHAHAQGILHRDIKPSNLLLDAQGTLWITDFGLAKADDSEDLTHSGEFVGTLRYMSPERFEGKADARTDVYALGVTLYEMLTLQPPFTGSDRMGLMGQIISDTPPTPGSLTPHLPRDLETIVQKAMAREPGSRYATARELADDLRRFLEHRPIKARRSSAAERLRRWCRRNPVIAGLTSFSALLLVVIAVGSSLLAVRLGRLNHEATENLEAAREAESEKTEKLWQSYVSEARARRFSRQVGQRFESLNAIAEAARIVRERNWPAERLDLLRNEAIACLALPDWRPVREWEGWPPGTYHYDSDAGHRLYARCDLHGHISVRRVDTDEEIAQLAGPPGENWLHFSPDGRFLALNRPGQAPERTWDLANTPPALIMQQQAGGCGEAFHPDSRHMVLTRADGSVLLADLTSAHQVPRRLAKFGDGPVALPTFDPRGSKLAVVTANERAVHVLDAHSGKDLSTPWLPKAPISGLAWHPAGKLLAAACNDSRIYVWDLTRGQQAAVLEGCRNSGIRVAFSPDGEFVVSQGFEGKLRFWHWRTGQQILSHPAGSNLRFSPDGRLLIVEDNRLKLIQVAVSGEYRSLVQQSSSGKDVVYWRGAIAPDGRLLAGAMRDGVRLWGLETGDELAHIGPNSVWGVAFASDSLVTNGPDGLSLWPIRQDPQPGTGWRIGPPRLLREGTHMEISCTKDGQVIAQPAWDHTLVVQRDRPARPLRLGPQADVRYTSMSPDGRFVATGSHASGGSLKVWETGHGQVVKELHLGSIARAVFSPDGRWLAVRGSEGGRILTVGTWAEGPAIPWEGYAAFSSDGSLLAVETGHGVIRLLDPATGREQARLEDPHQDVAAWLGFTPDDTRLIAVSNDGKAIHVWDLMRIRAELAQIGLDWNAPAYPERAGPAPGPLEVRVIDTELLSLQEATALNKQAWRLVTGPEGQRDPARALELIQGAMGLQPGNGLFLNTLGVAQYRNGQYATAVVTLEKSLAAAKGQYAAFDLFFLAMCHARLGEATRARDCFGRAVKWTEAQKDLPREWVAELKAFRGEAEAVLAGKAAR